LGSVRDFYSELKRRNVARVGIAYVVAGGLVIELVDTIASRLGMPDWVPTFIIVAVMIGLPIALVFSWSYEFTTQGLKKTHEVDADASITHSTGRRLDFAIIGMLVLALGYFVWDKFGTEPALENDGLLSIAVLPFVNMSSDPEQEYFSDGLSEELLNLLANTPGLQVAGRTSSFVFKGRAEDLRTIGELLNVSHLLEGSVRRSGNELRITAQLVRASDGFHLWSDIYDRELTDVFAVQDEIAGSIVAALQEQLLLVGTEVELEQPAVTVTTSNSYDLMLLARYRIRSRQQKPLEEARAFLQQVIEIDPDYAPGYAALALTTLLLSDQVGNYGDIPMAEASAESRLHLDRALALDPGLAQAHAVEGLYYRMQNEYQKSNASLRRATAINPNLTTAYLWLSNNLIETGAPMSETITARDKALAIDPLWSLIARVNSTAIAVIGDRWEEAWTNLERLETFYPEDAAIPAAKGEILALAGRRAEAISQFERAIEKGDNSVRTRNFLAVNYANLREFEKAASLSEFFEPTLRLAEGNIEEAVVLQKELLHLGPSAEAYLAVLLRLGGQQSAAAQVLEPWAASFDDFRERFGGSELGFFRRFDLGSRNPFLMQAGFLIDSGRSEEAKPYLDAVRAAVDQAEVDNLLPSDASYERARLAMFEGNKVAALEALQSAVNKGLLGFDLLVAEAWDSLRESNEFEKILADQTERLNAQRAILDLPSLSVGERIALSKLKRQK
jgi:TolB-like protein